MRLQKGFVLLPFLILIFVILIVFGASYWRGNKTSDSSEYTPQEKKTESSKIVYAKEIDSIDDSGNRRYPIYSVIQSNLDGSDKKEIFRVGDVNNYPRDFKLVKERNIVLVNMEHSLLAYNLETGERKELYQGARGQNYIFGFAVSHDGGRVAINISNDLYNTPVGYSLKEGQDTVVIMIIDLDDNKQEVILSKNIKEVGSLGWLTPEFWSSDDQKIYMRDSYPSEYIGYLWQINVDGLNLKVLSVSPGNHTPDGRYLAYMNIDSHRDVKWECGLGGGESGELRIFDTKINKDILVDKDTLGEKTINSYGWASDNRRLVYGNRKYLSGEECEATFAPEEFYGYDIVTQKTTRLTDISEVEKLTKPSPYIEAKFLSDPENPGGSYELKVDGRTIDVSDYGMSIMYIGQP
ncbi:MAG: hypothetical protein A3F61_03080 [Candidatus Blackburnbacteria bacterium RIFCSPHIGHO2_12_FULL_41_13b]|uniref:Dipeptidylpeptidase IV N-terminal domain-containing protein n=1 Tax=Candidatus Blackburnbacteria bacterium RIFCSPHIGHO2_12_FULL_41_13b TaxID=1797517 RepID=A0A1G1V797_9BACT|nr:MAG: hypothetical protein A3F61_03080 [Candidatus Blackburnbacteria bacterium RIFCSPHIGHO2_12_FULL_41_13b]